MEWWTIGAVEKWDHRSSLPYSIPPSLHHSVRYSEPHVSQHKRFEFVDVRRLEFPMDRSQSADDIDFDLFCPGDLADVVGFGFVDGMFDHRAIGCFALIHTANPAEFHRLTVHRQRQSFTRADFDPAGLGQGLIADLEVIPPLPGACADARRVQPDEFSRLVTTVQLVIDDEIHAGPA